MALTVRFRARLRPYAGRKGAMHIVIAKGYTAQAKWLRAEGAEVLVTMKLLDRGKPFEVVDDDDDLPPASSETPSETTNEDEECVDTP